MTSNAAMNGYWPKKSVFGAISGLVAIGWLVLAFSPDASGPDWLNTIWVGLILGTMFGQASLAAAWCALGPFPLVRRLPLSFLWLAVIVVAFGCNIARSSNLDGFPVLLVYGGGLVFQWLVLQTPLWLLVGRYGLRVCRKNEARAADDYRDRQFGIRQIMMLTILVAFVLGFGRLSLGGLKSGPTFGKPGIILAFACIALANALVSAPVVGIMLLPRVSLSAVGGTLLFSAFATVVEVSIINLLMPGPPVRFREYGLFSMINIFQCSWVLVVLLLLRRGGYRLTSRQLLLASGPK